jgi:hypothetical protein
MKSVTDAYACCVVPISELPVRVCGACALVLALESVDGRGCRDTTVRPPVHEHQIEKLLTCKETMLWRSGMLLESLERRG